MTLERHLKSAREELEEGEEGGRSVLDEHRYKWRLLRFLSTQRYDAIEVPFPPLPSSPHSPTS